MTLTLKEMRIRYSEMVKNQEKEIVLSEKEFEEYAILVTPTKGEIDVEGILKRGWCSYRFKKVTREVAH